MTGTLVKVRKAEAGTGSDGRHRYCRPVQSFYRAQLAQRSDSLRFQPSRRPFSPAAGSDAAPKSGDSSAEKVGRRRDEGIIDARGYISRVLMAWKATNVLPDEEGRLSKQDVRAGTGTAAICHRRMTPNGGPNAPLPVPATDSHPQRGEFVAAL